MEKSKVVIMVSEDGDYDLETNVDDITTHSILAVVLANMLLEHKKDVEGMEVL